MEPGPGRDDNTRKYPFHANQKHWHFPPTNCLESIYLQFYNQLSQMRVVAWGQVADATSCQAMTRELSGGVTIGNSRWLRLYEDVLSYQSWQ
jgi:hypothetical protein